MHPLSIVLYLGAKIIRSSSNQVLLLLLKINFRRWDFCFYKGNVVEHLDGHTDIIHKQLYSDWLPWLVPYLVSEI